MTGATSRPALQATCFLFLLTAWGAAHRHSKHHARATDHHVETGAYDKCSHPFHSWMCQPPPRPRSLHVTTVTPSRDKQVTEGATPDTLPLQDPGTAPPSITPIVPIPSTTPPAPHHSPTFPHDAAPSRRAPSNILGSLIPDSPTITAPEPRRSSILFSEPPAPQPQSPLASPSLPDTSTQNRSFLSPKALQQKPLYDQCSHPFHAWLCSSAARPRPIQRLKAEPRSTQRPPPLPTPRPTPRPTRRPTPRPTRRPTPRPTPRTTRRPTPRTTRRPTPRPTLRPTPRPTPWPTTRPIPSITSRPTPEPIPRPIPGPFPQASNPRKDSLLPLQTSTTPRSYDVCSHPFHSWRCDRPRLHPKPVTLGKSVKPAPAPPKPSPPSKVQGLPTPAPPLPEPTWDGADPCSHAFHSWLCNRPGPRPTRKPVVDPVLKPAASLPVAVPVLSLNNFLTSPTPPAAPPQLTTSQGRGKEIFLARKQQTPDKLKDPEPQAEPEPSRQDVCRHPFHSFLCSPLRPRSPIPALASSPIKESVASPAFHPPQTKVKPRREQESSPAPGSHLGHPCDHPFHSWLCDRRPNKSKKHQRRDHTRSPGRSKVVNTVADPAASSQERTSLTTVSPRPVLTVPQRPSLGKNRQESAALLPAPSTVHLFVSALPLSWSHISVSSPPPTSLSIDRVNPLVDVSRPSAARAQQ